MLGQIQLGNFQLGSAGDTGEVLFNANALIGVLAEASLMIQNAFSGEALIGVLAEASMVQTHGLAAETLVGVLTEATPMQIFNSLFGEALVGAGTDVVPGFTVFKYVTEAEAFVGATTQAALDFIRSVKLCISVSPQIVAVSSVVPQMPVAFITRIDKLIAGVPTSVCSGTEE